MKDPNSTGSNYPGRSNYWPWAPYAPRPAPMPNPFPVQQIVQHDTILTRARAIAEMLNAKAITRAEARKMIAALDPAFAKALGL